MTFFFPLAWRLAAAAVDINWLYWGHSTASLDLRHLIAEFPCSLFPLYSAQVISKEALSQLQTRHRVHYIAGNQYYAYT